MISPPLALRVVPNPYLHIDEHGRPAGAVPQGHGSYRDNERHPDPLQRFEPRRHIGAERTSTRLAADRTYRVGPHKIVKHGAHDHAWSFSSEAVSVPSTVYYHRAIKAGDLFAADLKTWVAAGGDPRLFQGPDEKLAQAKEGAIARFVAMHGADDPRLEVLLGHWGDVVEPRHPLHKAAHARAQQAKAEAEKAAKTTAAESKDAPASRTPAPATALTTKAGS